MSTRGRAPLPSGLAELQVIAEGSLDVPYSVGVIMEAVHQACLAETDPAQKPIVVLNRSFGQLRRQHPTIFSDLAIWLALPETQKAAASIGAYSAWAKWCQAANMLLNGVRANVAFGANQPGRPKSKQFSEYEDAAILAEHQAPILGSSKAEEEACQIWNDPSGSLDLRELQRIRVTVRACKPSNEELATQAELVKAKYRRS